MSAFANCVCTTFAYLSLVYQRRSSLPVEVGAGGLAEDDRGMLEDDAAGAGRDEIGLPRTGARFGHSPSVGSVDIQSEKFISSRTGSIGASGRGGLLKQLHFLSSKFFSGFYCSC